MKNPLGLDSLVKKISVKSAVNPSLWACGVISLPLFIMAYKTDSNLKFLFIIIALLPIIAFIVSYFYFLFKNPDYLRSEQYQLKMVSLKLLGDRDNPFSAKAKDIIEVINNPKLPSPNQNKIKTVKKK